MEPQDLNMTTTVTGHQLFLFVTLGEGQPDGELAEAIDWLQSTACDYEVSGPVREGEYCRCPR